MARKEQQKLKLLYLMKIFMEETDEEHGITMPQIKEALMEYGISAERKSLYGDIEALRDYGMDIIGEKKGPLYYYYLASRQFELAELKLLVDSVQASKFITVRKSRELIHKLETLSSHYEATKLHRQVFVAERVKTMNESIYYNVDKIHTAIGENVKISFQYFQWNVEKEMELRHDGKFYRISPWALTWEDENYYLIGFDSESDQIKHYRVDKMLKLELTEEKREGKEHFSQFDMAVYAKKRFGMFDGKEETVKLEFENRYAGVVIDRFGKELTLTKSDETHFVVRVNVAVSGQFLAWIIALGSGARILGPDTVLNKMKEEVLRLEAAYL